MVETPHLHQRRPILLRLHRAIVRLIPSQWEGRRIPGIGIQAIGALITIRKLASIRATIVEACLLVADAEIFCAMVGRIVG